MIKIFHNNRCSKSRCGIEVLENSGKPYEIVKYLENTPLFDELKDIISMLNIKPIELVRKNEAIWKSDFKGKELNDTDIINAMIQNPKLIERPIVINGDKAVVGRPAKLILDII